MSYNAKPPVLATPAAREIVQLGGSNSSENSHPNALGQDAAGAKSTASTAISVANARLPQSYASAKTALANCAQLDECQDWADKAAALASYAKQANDSGLMKMAVRIRDRAIRRAGELLKQIESQQGARNDLATSGSRPPEVTRTEAARDAGMSPHQTKQAIRVANVPAEEFEQQVESSNPPTVTALAEQGKRPAKPVLDLQGRSPEEFNRAMHYVGGWEYAAQDIAALDHERALPILTPSEIARLRAVIASIDAVTDRIVARI
ncbi:hypothetical protein [Mesorhizobium sp.]|uniref:hypothetical protein n=1 Tax=Mesorhizobium sp. TaxID=1871066 RepID=UPI000FE56B6C|nr:hypothetical protein [Mesorhizobium sp.]RWD23055.1 MAG: hypothetical protein EOS33_27235 [Mesorhizobium sp.]